MCLGQIARTLDPEIVDDLLAVDVVGALVAVLHESPCSDLTEIVADVLLHLATMRPQEVVAHLPQAAFHALFAEPPGKMCSEAAWSSSVCFLAALARARLNEPNLRRAILDKIVLLCRSGYAFLSEPLGDLVDCWVRWRSADAGWVEELSEIGFFDQILPQMDARPGGEAMVLLLIRNVLCCLSPGEVVPCYPASFVVARMRSTDAMTAQRAAEAMLQYVQRLTRAELVELRVLETCLNGAEDAPFALRRALVVTAAKVIAHGGAETCKQAVGLQAADALAELLDGGGDAAKAGLEGLLRMCRFFRDDVEKTVPREVVERLRAEGMPEAEMLYRLVTQAQRPMNRLFA
jgi:hypothetical protein